MNEDNLNLKERFKNNDLENPRNQNHLEDSDSEFQ